jgi:hypothetical protein
MAKHPVIEIDITKVLACTSVCKAGKTAAVILGKKVPDVDRILGGRTSFEFRAVIEGMRNVRTIADLYYYLDEIRSWPEGGWFRIIP